MADIKVKSAHCMQLCKSLWSLQQSGQLCDITLSVGEATLVGHRSVLAASSPLFLPEVSHDATDIISPPQIQVSDTTVDVVQEVIKYAYTGILDLDQDSVNGILHLCEKWQIVSGQTLCEKFKVKLEKDEKRKQELAARGEQRRSKRKNAGKNDRLLKWQFNYEKSDEDTVSYGATADDNCLPPADVEIKEEMLSDDEDEYEPPKKKVKAWTLKLHTPKLGRPPKTKPDGEKAAPDAADNVPKKRGRSKKIKVEGNTRPRKTTKKSQVKQSRRKVFKTCHKCHQHFDDPDDLVKHRQQCRKSSWVRPYTITKCRLCQRVFDTVEECSAHKKECVGVPEEETEALTEAEKITYLFRRCTNCKKVFDTPTELLEHKNSCKVFLAQRVMRCRKCKTRFEDDEEYQVHRMSCTVRMPMEKPSGERQKFKCEHCDKSFVKKRTLQMHIYNKHWSGPDAPGPAYYFCKVENCNFKTLYPHYMQKHVRWTHGENKFIMCDICGTVTKNEHYLKAHKRNRHSTQAPVYKCNICGLTMHGNRVHGEGKPTKLCSQCTYVTFTKSELDRHMFKKHGVPLPSGKPTIECNFCDYTAISQSVMDEHLMRHTAEKRQFPCTICNKSFITDKDLRGHLSIHNPDRKRHQCPYCAYSTIYGKSKLKQHVETMHEKKDYKPWACHICNYRSNIKGNLTLHLKNTHKIRVANNQRLIHNLEPLPASSKAPPTNRPKANRKPIQPTEQNGEQPNTNTEHEKKMAVSMISSELIPIEHEEIAQQPHAIPQEPSVHYTVPVDHHATTSLGTYKTIGVTEKEAKMFVLQIPPSVPEPIQPVSESAVLPADGNLGDVHNLATVASTERLHGHHPQQMDAYNLSHSPIVVHTESGVPQPVYMDTIINSLVSSSDQQM